MVVTLFYIMTDFDSGSNITQDTNVMSSGEKLNEFERCQMQNESNRSDQITKVYIVKQAVRKHDERDI